MDNSLHVQFVDVVFGTRHQGTFSGSFIFNNLVVEELILDNATENTVFLLLV